MVRRSEPPRRIASCSRISAHGVSRAVRLAISELRPWNTSALTLSRGTPSTAAISSWEQAPSSASTSAARCSSGSAETSASRSRRSWRRWTALERFSVDGSSAWSSGCSRRAFRTVKQRLRAIAYSHGRSWIGLVGAHQVAVGRHEGVLERVLGLLGRSQHVTAEAEDAAVVAVVDDLEGHVRAVADVRDEALVGRDAQQHVRAGRAEPARNWVKGRRSLHRWLLHRPQRPTSQAARAP